MSSEDTAASSLSTVTDDLKKISVDLGTDVLEAEVAQQQLLDWLSKGGASFGKLHLRLYDTEYEYRGVHARRDIGENELILLVPRHLIMTTEV